jgi:hypothetical protein
MPPCTAAAVAGSMMTGSPGLGIKACKASLELSNPASAIKSRELRSMMMDARCTILRPSGYRKKPRAKSSFALASRSKISNAFLTSDGLAAVCAYNGCTGTAKPHSPISDPVLPPSDPIESVFLVQVTSTEKNKITRLLKPRPQQNTIPPHLNYTVLHCCTALNKHCHTEKGGATACSFSRKCCR